MKESRRGAGSGVLVGRLGGRWHGDPRSGALGWGAGDDG